MKTSYYLPILALSWASIAQSQVSTPGLVAAYSFNEGIGTTLSDLSGNNVTGTIVGATWTTGGRYGNALSFNGSNSYVDLGNPAALQLTGSMTWSAWVKASANPADDGQIVSKSNSNSGWQLKSSPDTGPHTFGVAVSGSAGGHVQRYSSTVRALNTWYYVAGVYNATARTLDIYVNGVLSNGVLSGTVPASQVNTKTNVNIGRRSGGFYFNGIIDELRMYNRSLSQAEIQNDMRTPLGVMTLDTQAPSAPSTFSAATASSTQINLAWGAATDNVAVTGYRLERCQGTGCSNFSQIATLTTTSYSNTGLTPGTYYSYRVQATDAASNVGPYSSATGASTAAAPDTQAPSAPSTLSAAAASSTQVNLAWGAAADNVGVNGYRLERCQGTGCSNFAQIATLTTTSYSNTGLTAGTYYSYRVRATDPASNLGPYSNTAGVTTTAAADTQAPSAPSTLSASAASSTQMNLAWGAATDNVAVTGYRVERCQGTGCSNFAQIATLPATSFSDTGLTAGTYYSYRVRATDAASNLGPYSNPSGATTTAAADTQAPSAPSTLSASAASSTQMNLAWGAATDNVAVTGYRVERCQGTGCSNFAQIATLTTTSFSDIGLTAGTYYTYRVRATDAASNLGPYSNAAGATTTAVVSHSIMLTWNSSTSLNIIGYNVYRSTTSGGPYTLLNASPVATSSYLDSGVVSGQTYFYVATTLQTNEESAYSTQAIALVPTP